jgi:EmrB/QacA subfamily drug resistance transporter
MEGLLQNDMLNKHPMRYNIPIMQSSKTSVLIATTLGAFLTPFMGSAMNVAVPFIGQEFGMNATTLPWINNSFLIASLTFLLPFGRLADIYGRKKIFTWGIAAFTVFTFLCALANSTEMFLAFRALQGISGAMIFGTSVALVTSAYPPKERGRVLGINVASIYFALSIGPVAGGILVNRFGWESIFIATLPLCFIVLALIVWKLRGEWSPAQGESFDTTGAVIYGITIIAIMCGLSLLPELWGAGLIAAGVLALAGFIRYEIRARSPLLDISLFRRNIPFAFSSLAALINYAATFAVAFLLSLYLINIKGYTPDISGYILVTQPVFQAIFAPIAGRLSDRIEPRIIASIGMAVCVVGLVLFTLISETTSLWMIIGGQAILGFGFGLFSSPNTNAIMSAVETKLYGVAASTVATMRQVGMTLSMAIVTVLFAVYIGSTQMTSENPDGFMQSFKVAFIIFACLCFIGIFASLARGKTRRG